MSERVRDGWFVRAAGRVGDLGSPFYDDEHQRDVWNEASAVGFQLLLWLLPVVAVVSVWVGGAPAVPYALLLFVAPGLASWVVLGYARARGILGADTRGVKPLRGRVVAWLVLGVAFCAGVVRVQGSTDGFSGGMAKGLVIGAVLGVVVVAVAVLRGRRRAQRLSAGGRSS
ncbi:DUF2029 domain-containing protein [Quadrisphaera setariae]|uniref:DUF2029 domain-containing protein n=1 Tax=Quadrisphaera setariae TaxID=2593304 RepID=A0A5C8ZF85_9ACTN|nr:DUF2029 domain-containing protein [Quadrisphaera setariae]TXR55838.1 DUF2029 domain-containing protein [Quadrisphaera setariae]